MSFIELYDFIIYQHLNTRTKILPLATSRLAYLYNYFNHAYTVNFKRVARNSQWGSVLGVWGRSPSRCRPMGVWGRSPQLPEAGVLRAKPSAAGGTGVWELCPQRSKILHLFCKNNFILGLFWLKNNAFKTWH